MGIAQRLFSWIFTCSIWCSFVELLQGFLKCENSGINTGMMFSAIVSALKLAAFPCFPQVDEIFCVRAAALIFCVDHRASHYLREEEWNWVLNFFISVAITELDKVLSNWLRLTLLWVGIDISRGSFQRYAVVLGWSTSAPGRWWGGGISEAFQPTSSLFWKQILKTRLLCHGPPQKSVSDASFSFLLSQAFEDWLSVKCSIKFFSECFWSTHILNISRVKSAVVSFQHGSPSF